MVKIIPCPSDRLVLSYLPAMHRQRRPVFRAHGPSRATGDDTLPAAAVHDGAEEHVVQLHESGNLKPVHEAFVAVCQLAQHWTVARRLR